jgi:hypothetical protein
MGFCGFAVRRMSFALLGGFLSLIPWSATAQDSGKGVELHANGSATAADVGLPVYPGSKLAKTPGSDSAVDMGFTFGDTHFRLVAAKYVTEASPAQILDFYRKPLARYGDVLECEGGKPVGAVKKARTGLTCSDSSGNEDSSESHELRAGTPQRFRIVAIGDHQGPALQFGLVYVEMPKNSGSSR